MVYTDTKYAFTPIDSWFICTDDIGMAWVKFELKQTCPTYFGVMYRPPSGNIQNCMDLLENRILDIQGDGEADILVMGDMNINLLLRHDSKKREYMSTLNRLKLTHLIYEPTRVMLNTKTCNDHMFTNRTVMYNNAGVIDFGLSDHALIYVPKKKVSPNVHLGLLSVEIIGNLTPLTYQRELSHHDWSISVTIDQSGVHLAFGGSERPARD